MTTHAATSGTTREDTMSTRRTPEEMAADRLMTEADACAAAYALIGQAHRRPYAGDPDLKRLRRDALDALMTLDRALYTKAFALFDADNEGGDAS